MTKNVNQEFIATHVHPAWKSKADYVFRCRINSSEGKSEWEQMWGKIIEPDVYMLCCIPFFIYGLSLGDIIKIDENHNFEIIEKSKNVTLRIFTGSSYSEENKPYISKILEMCDNAEQHSKILIALSIENDRSYDVIDVLEELTKTTDMVYEVSSN